MIHILITRPLETSVQLANQLKLAGVRSIIMPLYTFSPCDPGNVIDVALANPETHKLATFTSPRAVQFGLEHIPQGHLNKLEFAAIGSATRKALEQSGLKVHVQSGSGFTSEDLLRVPQLQVDPGNAIIFCAPGGRKKLAKGLQDLGWEVSLARVYQRQPLRPTQDQLDAISAADKLITVWTSTSALDLARQYLSTAVWSKILHAPALVISARMKHHLLQAGATHVELAEGPGNNELLRSIKALLSNNG